MTHDDLREAVARAIWECADDEVGWAATVALAKTGDAYMVGQVEFVRREADAALAAIREAGLSIVPFVPTEAMLQAGQQERDDNALAYELWGAMVKAAQEGKP